MAYAAMDTFDALDLMGVEVQLDFALDELRDTLNGDPQAGPLLDWICDTVHQVESRVIQGPADVQANVEALQGVRQALARLGIAGQEAVSHVETYLGFWLKH